MVALALAAMALVMAPAADGATIVVPDDYTTIQDAIDNAVAGDTIRVYSGTYSEDLNVNIQVEIIGNGTTETIIKGSSPDAVELSADGINLSKVRIEGGGTSGIYVKGADCVIEDVYVTGSSRGLRTSGADRLYIGNSTFTSNSDYGMIIHLADNVTIYGCTITDNTNEDGIRVNADVRDLTISHTLVDGNGLWGLDFFGPNWDVVIDSCTISNNSVDGVFMDTISGLVFRDNKVSNNVDLAIFIFVGDDMIIEDNLISNNGWGLYLSDSASTEIVGNTIRDNDGLGIGIFDSGVNGPLWIHHNLIEGNGLVFMGQDSGINIGGFTNSRFNVIEDNEIFGNYKGIVLMYNGVYDNVFRRNIIKDNGLAVENYSGAKGNTYYHNTFLNNTGLFTAPDSKDSLDSGHPNGGNYWDTYAGKDLYGGPSQDVMGPDGLGDTPFALTATVSDGFPLMMPWGDNPLAKVTITHPGDGDLVEGTLVAEAVVSGDLVSSVEWYLDDTLVGRDVTLPYQLVLDTTTLSEDATHTLEAMAYLRFSLPISDTVDITVNNMAQEGAFIAVSTAAASYMPDDTVAAIVSLQTPPMFDTIDLHASWTDAAGTTVQVPVMEYPAYSVYGFTFRLSSDVPSGNVSLEVKAMAFFRGSNVWNSTNSTTFPVDGGSHHQQLADLLADLTTVAEDIEGLNVTNQAQLAAALADILSGLDGLDGTITTRMDELEGSIADNSTALQEYIDLQTQAIQLLIDDMTANLSAQLAAIDQAISEFREEAGVGLAGIAAYLEEMEANGSARHGEVLEGLDETYALLEEVNDTTLDDLRTRLIELRDDLATLDDNEAARHSNTVDVMVMGLDGLSTEVSDGFNATDSQLAALSKLDDIMGQLDRLSDDVADLGDSAGEGSTSMNMLLILAFGIITILLLALLMIRVKDMAKAPPPPPPPREMVRPMAVPARKVAPVVAEESFELMMEEPEMYPDTDGPIMMTPEAPPEALPEAPPEEPPEIPLPPSFPEAAEVPDAPEAPMEVPPPQPEVLEEVPPPPSEMPPLPVPPPPPEVPPPALYEAPVETPLEEISGDFELEPIPEEAIEVSPEQPLEAPAGEPPAEAPPEGPAPEEEPREGPDDEGGGEEEHPGRRNKSPQEWVVDEILEEI